MSARALSLKFPNNKHLRAFNIRQDLLAVADLVELCFKDTLDADGRMYIRQMRRTAKSSHLLTLVSSSALSSNLPPGGFVWEESGELVGNLSLIPFVAMGKRRYLIANVAVAPDYRRMGIASELTIAALKKAKQQGADEIWLQADADNQAAQKLYSKMGFISQAQRITWQAKPSPDLGLEQQNSLHIRLQLASDWPQQIEWLKKVYPDNVRWNLPLNFKQFQPGFLATVQRLLGNQHSRQWAATKKGQLLGLLCWQSSSLQADRLWLAIDEKYEEETILDLLAHGHLNLRRGRGLLLNYPANRGESQFRAMGFRPMRQLIWMQYSGN